MPLNPSELRQQADTVKQAQARERDLERQRKDAEHLANAKAAMDDVPKSIRWAESEIKSATNRGGTRHTISWWRGRTHKLNPNQDRHYADCVMAPAQAVADYFNSHGFVAEVKYDNETEYNSDSAGPGDDVVTIEIDWSQA